MLGLALVTLIGPSLTAVVVVVVISTLPGYGRVVRAQTMTLKQSEFVLAARALGASDAGAFFRSTSCRTCSAPFSFSPPWTSRW